MLPPTATPAIVPRKVCLLGAPGVGKTSLAQRLARDRFPPQAAGPGITVALSADADEPLACWDVAASCAIDSLNQAFLSRVDVLLAVAAAEVTGSLELGRALLTQAQRLHPQARTALLLNKSDLDASLPPASTASCPVFAVSAREGSGLTALRQWLREPTRT
jgi:GTPase SAR1 family protein